MVNLANPVNPGTVVLLWLLGLAWAGGALAAEVTAELDRARVVVGETVELVLQTDDPQQSLDTDLTVLEDDFEVLGSRAETQMSIVSGRQSAKVRQLITLEPKRSGELVIPPLRFSGGGVTRPLALTVEPAPVLAPGEAPPVFIEVDLEPVEGPYYVHAQIAFKVRIFYQQNLTEASISPPSPGQASVRLLDEVPYTADRNGERYRVLERRYAIFPERSGELVIPPLELTGRLIEKPSDRLWQPRVRGRGIRTESNPVILTVKPRPPSFTGDQWLPAREVTLAQQITDGASVRVGEPVTRTVILDAVGLEEHMLEEPAWPELPGARIYPDQPQGISRDNGEWVLGHREYRYAVVPEVEGELVLPEIRLRWWDTLNDRERVAVLPEHRVQVLPSPARQSVADSTPSIGTSAPNGVGGEAITRWRWLTGLFAVLWLATLGLWISKRAPARPRSRRHETESPDESALVRTFIVACEKDDVSTARHQLRRWLNRFGPAWAAGSLGDFARGVDDPELARELRELDAAGFRPEDGEGWEGGSLSSAFRRWRKTKRAGAGKAADVEPDLWADARRTDGA